MSAPASPAAPALIFNWDPPRRRSLVIAGFLLGSVLLHATCFYLFQIVYPPAVALLPPPARVQLINPNSEEGRSLLRWVDAEDPALASSTQRPPDARQRPLPKVQHVPSYLIEEPKLKPVPAPTPDVRAPSSQPPGPVELARHQPAPPLGKIPTQVEFSEELAASGSPHLGAPQFTASNNESPQAVRFRIAVSPRGEIRYCFLLNSSGDPALDEQSRHYLGLARFAPRETPATEDGRLLTWGIATVEWGNDVARSPAATPRPGAP